MSAESNDPSAPCNDMCDPAIDMGRYRRQVVLPELGENGQQIFTDASILIVGAGATGSFLAELLARSGIGKLTIIDRDFVEKGNLHRQFGYTEADIGQPKAQRIAERLRIVNSSVEVSFRIMELDHRSVLPLIEEVAPGLVMDATDNIYTRQVLNDACFKQSIPWVYCGATGTTAMAAAFSFESSGETSPIEETGIASPGSGEQPHARTGGATGPCFRCLMPELPPPGVLPTCETAGILNTTAATAASMAATCGMKLLLGKPADGLLINDIWTPDFQRIDIPQRDDCGCCIRNELDFLDGKHAPAATKLCGEQTFQLQFPGKMQPDEFEALKRRLETTSGLQIELSSAWHFQFLHESFEITIFRDGRAMIKGVDTPEEARVLFDRFVGV